MIKNVRLNWVNLAYKCAQLFISAKIPLKANGLIWLSLALGMVAGIFVGVGSVACGTFLCALSFCFRSLAIAIRDLRGETLWLEVIVGRVMERLTELFVLMGLVIFLRDTLLLQLEVMLILLGSTMLVYSNVLAEAQSRNCDLLPRLCRRLEKVFILFSGPVFFSLRENLLSENPLLIRVTTYMLILLIAVLGGLVNIYAVLQFQRLIKIIYPQEANIASNIGEQVI